MNINYYVQDSWGRVGIVSTVDEAYELAERNVKFLRACGDEYDSRTWIYKDIVDDQGNQVAWTKIAMLGEESIYKDLAGHFGF